MDIASKPTTNGASFTSARADRIEMVGIGAASLFTLLLALLHFLEPKFDPSWRFVSEYALGQFGWIMPLAFAAMAVSISATALIAWKHSKGLLRYVGVGILALAAIGLCIAAIFPTDPITTPVDQSTSTGSLHMLGASLNYTPLGALLISFALTQNPDWKAACALIFGTAILTIVATIGFVASMPADFAFGPGLQTGWWNRLILLSYVAWIIAVCWNAARISKSPS